MDYFKIKSNKAEAEPENVDSSSNYLENYGERSYRNRLIVMDDVSGLADLSSKFANFLTVVRKFRYHCLYIFHAIDPEKSVWKTILSQTNLLNIFPASVPLSTVKKVLEANCIRNSNKYIPVNSLWITKLFIRLANNETEKTCLTIDCTGFNPNGSGRFRTDAGNPLTQTCFFNKADQDSFFNVFVNKRIKKDSVDKVLFEIERLKTVEDNETYSATSELENLQGNGLSNARVSSDERVDGSEYANGDIKGKLRTEWKSARPKFMPGR